ncbi:AAA family ATPase [Rothia nasimurium]|uniref:AAA family ATPase n=1 Tax=Rothia nasimurium TaxID=85336 RepID=UPI001F2917C3|nr:AAA family ATPase [Rothia nasimurium]
MNFKVKFQNLGPIKFAEYEVKDLTIISGKNGTGKTFSTYALYGFLRRWVQFVEIPQADHILDNLYEKGVVYINLQTFIPNLQEIVDESCSRYTRQLYRVFGTPRKNFENSEFQIEIDVTEVSPPSDYHHSVRSGNSKTDIITAENSSENPEVLKVTMLQEDGLEIPRSMLKDVVNHILSTFIFGNIFPRVFIASAERTGVALFRRELDFSRNKLLTMLREANNSNSTDMVRTLLDASDESAYAVPVEDNVNYIRDLEDEFKKESYISSSHPEILNRLVDISGGEFKLNKSNELRFTPNSNRRVSVGMDDGASSVRSMVIIDSYLRHSVKRGDLLIIDEPELNLHPANQRNMARLISSLIKIGLKVMVTTHSDYFIKELNTLIMLNSLPEKYRNSFLNQFKYSDTELLDVDRVSAYSTGYKSIFLPGRDRKSKNLTLVKNLIEIDSGIEVGSFDETLVEIDEVQSEIYYFDSEKFKENVKDDGSGQG